ncbi:MAG TPA: (2Fe-2S)-binding protein [Polyangia bacterium]|nr:(2Fe-2S)-binding protein [Polyangia bacterium]
MLVCHCRRVCDRTIRECIREGAESIEEVGRACGAGTGCGGCQPAIASLLAKTEAPVAEGRLLIRVLGPLALRLAS